LVIAAGFVVMKRLFFVSDHGMPVVFYIPPANGHRKLVMLRVLSVIVIRNSIIAGGQQTIPVTF